MTNVLNVITRYRDPATRPRRRKPRTSTTTVVVVLLALVVLATVIAPLLTSYGPTQTTSDILIGPSAGHPFGTDHLGRDVFSRTLYGGRSTLLSASIAVLLATAAGVSLGLIAGYGPKTISTVIMRAMDIVLGFPALLLALLILATVGSGLLPKAIAVAIGFLPIFTRVVYTSTISAKEEGFVTAARVIGVPAFTIVRRHVAPAVSTEVLVIMTSAFGWSILLDSALSFLGLGVEPPNPDWGVDLNGAQGYLANGWWVSVAPGLAITVTVLLINVLGDLLSTRSKDGGKNLTRTARTRADTQEESE